MEFYLKSQLSIKRIIIFFLFFNFLKTLLFSYHVIGDLNSQIVIINIALNSFFFESLVTKLTLNIIYSASFSMN